MKKLLTICIMLLLALAVMSCNDSKSGSEAGGAVELRFMYWGSLVEKDEVEKMIVNYNNLNEGKIHVTGQHVPDDYPNKLATMIAGNTAPDICYLGAGEGAAYAQEGRLLFVEDIPGVEKSYFDTIVPSSQWKVGGKVAFFGTAIEHVMLTYNRDIFDELGVPYPPSKAEDAFNWDEFVDLLRKLTIDVNGNNALSPNFDSTKIATYGLSLTTYFNFINPFAASNGASVLNAAGTDTDFASPAWIDTMNKINDLIHRYHVVPTPAEASALANEAMLAGQVAMTCDGNWSLLDYQQQGLNVGMAVYPDLGNGSWSTNSTGLTVILANTKYPQESWDFYKFSLDAREGPTDLYKKGLWQPIFNEYYTDADDVAFWVDTPAHPQEYRDVVIANINRNIVPQPQSYITRWNDVYTIINPAIQSVFGNPGDAGPAFREAQATITATKAFKGRFDQ